jgi:hypothetical protein
MFFPDACSSDVYVPVHQTYATGHADVFQKSSDMDPNLTGKSKILAGFGKIQISECIHRGVEVTESSNNKQHTLSNFRATEGLYQK